ncbi:MAG: lysine-sensitive aspartokinase 3 [Acidobacteriota bacterium]
MLVMKFGGTSVEDSTAIRRLMSIVNQFIARRPIVVVSAMGKTTNGLLECGRQAAAGEMAPALTRLSGLASHHLSTVAELASGAEVEAIQRQLQERFAGIEQILTDIAAGGSLTPRLSDALAANGELLSSTVVAAAFRGQGIGGVWVDIRPAMVTSEDHTRAAVQFEQSNPRLRELFTTALANGGVPVTQGFIGATMEGTTTTIGRGGSDYSAAIIGAALGAEEIQIWTDVDGILSTDPRIVPTAIKVRTISFAEASELAYFGAKVLHPSTLLPAMSKEIPVLVCNSRRPEVKGTAIVREAPPSRALVKAIAFKRGITVVNVSSDRMLMAHGFLARLFDIFNRHETAIDMVATSEVSVSMTLDDTRNLAQLLPELRQLGEVVIEPDQALICLVGESLKFIPGVAAQIFGAITDINVSMISHGASAINLSFIVSGQKVEEAVQRLHDHFFRDPDEETFEIPGSNQLH